MNDQTENGVNPGTVTLDIPAISSAIRSVERQVAELQESLSNLRHELTMPPTMTAPEYHHPDDARRSGTGAELRGFIADFLATVSKMRTNTGDYCRKIDFTMEPSDRYGWEVLMSYDGDTDTNE